jgi:hypothetical protein
MELVNEGTPIAIRIAAIINTTINSIMVNPPSLVARTRPVSRWCLAKFFFTEILRFCLVLKLAVADHHRNPYQTDGDSAALSGAGC